ncbi:protein phosphatase 2C domain-containing protein [Streptomyces sp. NPDC005402]|uniref:protein phosphatase 2C domain-containing protein n=1 Tax=Streptomyces sp. NPDC005402 TaxID=3155338 RepID=UPI0033B747F6
MSQQGGRPTGHEDDWWGQLYDSADDTGPTRAPDTLDDRFASAAGAVRDGSTGEMSAADGGVAGAWAEPAGGGAEPGAGAVDEERSPRSATGVPAQRTGVSDATASATGQSRASWEPPPDAPAAFPPGPKPPGFVERAPEDRPPSSPGGPASTETPPATTLPASRMPTEPPSPPTAAPPPPSAPPRPAAPPLPPPDAERAVPPGAGDPVGPVSRDGADPGRARGDRPVSPDRADARGPGFRGGGPDERGPAERGSDGAGSGEGGPGEGPVSATTAFAGRAEDVPTPGRAESPPGPWEPGGAGTRRGGSDWWAGRRDPDPGPDAGSAEEPPAVAPPPRTGPGSTRPNPTPEPSGHGQDGPAPVPQAPRTATRVDLPTLPPAPVGFVGSGPPTYDAEPTALPPADPDELDDLVADTVLDGARYGACTLRAVSVRGDSARFRGEPRRDSLLTARFGTGDQALILVAMATGARATPGAHRAAAEACHWIGRAVGRSHARLAQDIGAARRGDLKSGLHRLTDRSLGKLRASAVEQGIDPEEYAATLRCLLLPADPDCRVRVFFGVGAGGLFRLRDGEWHDIEPRITDVTGEPVVGFGSLPPETPDGDRLTMDLGIPTPPSPYEPAPEPPREAFRFRASVARPGDALLMCTGGLADPLRGEPDLCEYLTGRWSGPPPGLAAFLADSQVRVKGYADDRTAAAVWEA